VKIAFWRDFGFMPARVVIAKFFAGAISIGGGCSLGREGPTVHIAGALASNIAGWLGIAKQGRRPALLSGAAAGFVYHREYSNILPATTRSTTMP
jgi:CIC family chloride channel protein